MKMKKVFGLLSVLMILSMLLSACGSKPAEPKVLNVWIEWGDNPQQIQTLFDKYTAETGIKVIVTASDADRLGTARCARLERR
jgi:ABC-type glycerol-3-phosphate transport system substrate-binding protein